MEVLLVLKELLATASGAAMAAEQIAESWHQAQADGRDLTLDEVKSFAGLDDKARDALAKAIAEVES